RAASLTSALLVGGLERLQVEFAHLEQGVHDRLRIAALRIRHYLLERGGDDLPRHAEAIRHPAAGTFLSASRGELAPDLVQLALRLADRDQGERVGEGEVLTAVESTVFATVQLEGRVQDLSLGDGSVRRPAIDAHDP